MAKKSKNAKNALENALENMAFACGEELDNFVSIIETEGRQSENVKRTRSNEKHDSAIRFAFRKKCHA